MRWAINIVIITGLALSAAGTAQAAPAQSLLIDELSVGSADNSREEFIELYNASPDYLDFSTGQWQLQIAGGSAKDWSAPPRTITLTGYLYPGYRYLIGTSFSQTVDGVHVDHYFPEEADARYASALSATAGHVRLIRRGDTNTQVAVDEIEWGATSIDGRMVLGLQASLKPGIALQRRVDDNDVYLDSDDDSLDFALTDSPTPESTTAEQPPAILTPEPTEAGDPTDDSPDAEDDSPLEPPRITELLPNPADPLTDANDEYIELYNPNMAAINLRNYTLQSGLKTFHSYRINADTILQPLAYLVLYSRQTRLSLSNSGGQARLLDPTGSVVAESALYGKAPDGLAWQLEDGAWQWSAKATPATANQYLAPLLAPARTSKITAKPAAKAIKKKAAKAVAKTAKKKTAKKTVQTALVANKPPAPSVIHGAILAAVLTLALLYGAYEYRHDLANRYRKLRGDRQLRRGPWQKLTRRRGDPADQ